MIPVMSPYSKLSREELICLLDAKDNEIKELKSGCYVVYNENQALHSVLMKVLLTLHNEDDQPLKNALALLLDYFKVDLSYIGVFDDKGLNIDLSYAIRADRKKSLSGMTPEFTIDMIPWVVGMIKSRKDIVISDIYDLPEEVQEDRKLMEEMNIRSLLIAPLVYHGKTQGFIGFSLIEVPHSWTSVEINEIHLVANIFSIIIECWQVMNNLSQSKKQISELSGRFKLFFDNLPVGVELYDADGFMIDVNDADTQIFGTNRENLLGINLFNHPNGTEELLGLMRSGQPFNYPFVYQFCNVQKSGYYQSEYQNSVKYLTITGMGLGCDENLKPIGYLVIVTDETEKQIKEEQIKNNLAILKAILLSGQSLVAEYDIDMKQLFVNPVLNDKPANNKLFKFLSSGDKLSFEDLKYVIRTEDNIHQLLQVIEGKQEHCSFICRTKVDEETIWIRFNAQAYQSRWGNRLDKLVCYITNITEEKTLEEKLHFAEYETRRSELEMQKVREADKLKSAFLANMSHEIRTPLNAIVGFSGLLVENCEEDENHEFVEIINENTELLLRLVSDILDFSKIESGILNYYPEETDLKELCFGQYRIHSLKMPENVSLIYDMNVMPDVILYTDPRRVTQVISNLISNAAKFTEKGTVTLSYHLVGDAVQFEVSDTGIGIQPQHLHTIFERFYKIDSFKQGTGLGLTICKTIVESLKGTIGVDSVPGKGSCFWFTLPYTR